MYGTTCTTLVTQRLQDVKFLQPGLIPRPLLLPISKGKSCSNSHLPASAGCLSLSLSLQPSPATRKPSSHVQRQRGRILTPAIQLVRQPCEQRHPSSSSTLPATRTRVRLHRHHRHHPGQARSPGGPRGGPRRNCSPPRRPAGASSPSPARPHTR